MSTATLARRPSYWPVAGLSAALAVAVFMPVHTVQSGPTICPFRILTGLPCPTCGMTRAWTMIAHGQWSSAMAENPMAPLVLALAIATEVYLLRRLVNGRPLPPWLRTIALPVVAVVVGVFGLTRMYFVGTGQWQWS